MDYRIFNIRTGRGGWVGWGGGGWNRQVWKLTPGEKTLAAPGNRTCISSVPIRLSYIQGPSIVAQTACTSAFNCWHMDVQIACTSAFHCWYKDVQTLCTSAFHCWHMDVQTGCTSAFHCWYGAVPKGSWTFLGSLYKEVAKTVSGTLVYRFERQIARKKKSSFQKHWVLDLECGILSQEPSGSCILYLT